ncbi:9898_t:CDS:2 [Diversispora eburnea]|uniref:Dol-P-Man:Man(5)GlcNAc(2)-PP-Dol alpha-1,3-mannosyltransferase n=1 Tax=Diversispora eburnea TaxID=1213867 RepID=A0A9N9C2K9_9GLOM|nr:9898_t:CDS:2 [Diversispora eburnea]
MNTDNEENKNSRPVITTEELTLTTVSYKLLRLVRSFLFDPEFFWYTGSYTEIDWEAYMQEVEIFLNGERDYMKLIGNTGPSLYYITSGGIEIQKAQYLFAIIYLWTLYTVFNIYHKSRRIPPYVLILICLSKRLHSIYVLRLFNDTITMAFLYTCIWALINKRWKLSCVLYSLALSVKMNVLLFFPAFGILLFKTLGAWKTFFHLAIVGFIQIILGYPFISTYPQSYLKRSFEFSRVFIYKWTVNWKFFDKMTFESIGFSNSLLTGHICVLFLFLFRRWCRKDNGVISLLVRGFVGKHEELVRQVKNVTADHITTLMLTSNFIGIVFSRTLHYQFYSWYFHGLPFLLWHCIKLPVPFRFLILAVIESCWNVYPSTSESSLLLLICHLIILVGLWNSEDLEQ